MFSPSLSSSLRQVTTRPVLDTLFLRRFWILLSSSGHSSLVLCTNSSPTLCLRLWGRPSLFHTSWALTEAPLASVLVLQPELQAGLPQPHSHVCMGLSSHRSQRHSDPTEMRSLTYIHTHTPCPACLVGWCKQKEAFCPISMVAKHCTYQSGKNVLCTLRQTKIPRSFCPVLAPNKSNNFSQTWTPYLKQVHPQDCYAAL